MRPLRLLQVCGFIALGVSSALAQAPPPIHGVTGTIATEGTIKNEHKAAHKVAVETADGVEHVYDAATGLTVHGGKGALADLAPGTKVVVHYTPDNTVQEIDRIGEGGLRTTEGVATKIDRGRKEITIRYDNGKSEKMKLTDRAAADAGTNIGPDERIVVYYSEQSSQKTTHYFKKVK